MQSFGEDGSVVWESKDILLALLLPLPLVVIFSCYVVIFSCYFPLLQSFGEDGSVVWESKDILLALLLQLPLLIIFSRYAVMLLFVMLFSQAAVLRRGWQRGVGVEGHPAGTPLATTPPCYQTCLLSLVVVALMTWSRSFVHYPWRMGMCCSEAHNQEAYADGSCTLFFFVQSFGEDGSVVWESKDILLALEERFPHASPLLPTDEEEKQKVRMHG
jgi:hypothetical protein